MPAVRRARAAARDSRGPPRRVNASRRGLRVGRRPPARGGPREQTGPLRGWPQRWSPTWSAPALSSTASARPTDAQSSAGAADARHAARPRIASARPRPPPVARPARRPSLLLQRQAWLRPEGGSVTFPIPLPAPVVKLVRFFVVELPRERLAVHEKRTAFARRNAWCPGREDDLASCSHAAARCVVPCVAAAQPTDAWRPTRRHRRLCPCCRTAQGPQRSAHAPQRSPGLVDEDSRSQLTGDAST